MTKPPLTVHNAEITTARVEIKTLTVSGKQVTLAVFRQLRNVPILGDDGVLAGDPWGTVNYHPDRCADHPQHWHVVWQHGTDLLRSFVYVEPRFEQFWPEEADRFITSCLYDFATHGSTPFFDGEPTIKTLIEPRTYRNTDPGMLVQEAALTVRMALSDQAHEVATLLLRLADERHKAQTDATWEAPWRQAQLEKTAEQFAGKLAALGEEVADYQADTEELYTAYKASVTAEIARRARHEEARKTIAALPQLFIAV